MNRRAYSNDIRCSFKRLAIARNNVNASERSKAVHALRNGRMGRRNVAWTKSLKKCALLLGSWHIPINKTPSSASNKRKCEEAAICLRQEPEKLMSSRTQNYFPLMHALTKLRQRSPPLFLFLFVRARNQNVFAEWKHTNVWSTPRQWSLKQDLLCAWGRNTRCRSVGANTRILDCPLGNELEL